jgi:hypothetical protein
MGWAARPWRARVLQGVEHHPDCWAGPGQPEAFKPRQAVKSKANLCSWCMKTPFRPHLSLAKLVSLDSLHYQRDVVSCDVR